MACTGNASSRGCARRSPSPKNKPKPPPPPLRETLASRPSEAPSDLGKEPVTPGDGLFRGSDETERYAKYQRMLRAGVPKPAVAQKMRTDGLDPSVLDDSDDDSSVDSSVTSKRSSAPPPPPLPRPAVVVEDEPVRSATPTQGLMSGNLLSAIQQGTTLKKAVVEEEEVREKPNDLLSAIKRGANLRKVSDAPPAEPPQTKGRGGLLGNEVDKILNLRAKIAAASESSSSDSGSDWD